LTSVPLSPPTAEPPVGCDLLLASLRCPDTSASTFPIWLPRGVITARSCRGSARAVPRRWRRVRLPPTGRYLFFYPSAEQSRYSRHQAGLQHLASMVRFMGSPPVRQSPPGTSTGLVPASGTGSSTAVRNPAAGWRCWTVSRWPVWQAPEHPRLSRWQRCTCSRRAAAIATASNGSTSTATRRTGSPRTTTTACPGGIGPGGEMADRCPARRL